MAKYSCVIANNARKQQKLGYNLEVHDVMKYTRKHRAIKCYRRLRNNYACLQALVNNKLTWQSSCVIANNARKQQKLFVQGYNLEVHVHDVRNKVHAKTSCHGCY